MRYSKWMAAAILAASALTLQAPLLAYADEETSITTETTEMTEAVETTVTTSGEIATAENKTDFFYCVAWNGTAKLLERHFHKGERILLEGSLHNRTYLDKMEEKRTVAEIHVDKVFFIEKKSNMEEEAELEELF